MSNLVQPPGADFVHDCHSCAVVPKKMDTTRTRSDGQQPSAVSWFGFCTPPVVLKARKEPPGTEGVVSNLV